MYILHCIAHFWKPYNFAISSFIVEDFGCRHDNARPHTARVVNECPQMSKLTFSSGQSEGWILVELSTCGTTLNRKNIPVFN